MVGIYTLVKFVLIALTNGLLSVMIDIIDWNFSLAALNYGINRLSPGA